MDKEDKKKIRLKVWEKLKNVALPDSRFHLNFEEYIPDFKDSINACNQITKSDEYKNSKLLFITPDNCLTSIREQAIKLKITGEASLNINPTISSDLNNCKKIIDKYPQDWDNIKKHTTYQWPNAN